MTRATLTAGVDSPPASFGTTRSWLRDRSQGPIEPGHVLVHAPSHVFQAPGGGENQLVQTSRALEAQGVRLRLFNPWVDRLGEARLIHLFGMSREGLEIARVATSLQIPIVLSPIFWSEPRALCALASSRTQAAGCLARWTAQRLVPRWPRWRRELLKLSTLILPNSETEARQLVRLFAIDAGKIRVVPNGVDPRFAAASPDLWHNRHGTAPFVLYVGRIEPRKNVLGLVRATRDAGLALTVLGDAPPDQGAYLAACRAEGGSTTRWLSRVDHEDPSLASAYAAARVVALPSWFETPGLSVLEGALAGAAVVVTPFGCTREYFGSRVLYARPDRPDEIRQALQHAWEAGPDPRLAPHVRSHYLWSEVARRTARVYDQVAG